MSRKGFRIALYVLAVACCAACRSTDDYLADLDTTQPQILSAALLNESNVVFDAGQLAHEAFVGLAVTEEMYFWQAMLSMSSAAKYLSPLNKDALLRADAATLLGRLAVRIPVPPLSAPFEITENAEATAEAKVTEIGKARDPLRAGTYIALLDSPDETMRQAGREELKKLVPEQNFASADEWKKWWEVERPTRYQTFLEQSREPARTLGLIRFKNASAARSVLRFVAFWLREYDVPELDDAIKSSVLAVARQAVVFSLSEAINDPSPLVRADVAEAMGAVHDPAFADPLARQLARDRDPVSATKIIRALAWYPTRRTILALIAVMELEDQRISVAANEVLAGMTGVDLGPDFEPWSNWWAGEGANRWP